VSYGPLAIILEADAYGRVASIEVAHGLHGLELAEVVLLSPAPPSSGMELAQYAVVTHSGSVLEGLAQ